jgi:hemerythrin-like metal-binding protein
MPVKQLQTELTGVLTIDAQHKELQIKIERLLAAKDKTTLALCVMALYQHFREHIAYEERLMRQLKYPAMKAHTDQHQGLISRLNAMVMKISTEPIEKAELDSFITELTQNHVGRYDSQLGAFIRLKESSPN